MYCGKNKTAITSQQAVAEAFLRLLSQKPFSEISVSGLCKEAGISRQTFYSLFQSRENVIVFILQEKYCYTLAEEPEECSCTVQHFCSGYARYIVENHDFLSLLVSNNLTQVLYDSICDSFCSCCCGQQSPEEQAYVSNFIAGGMTGIVKGYTEGGCTTDVQALQHILLQLFTGMTFA